MDMIDVIRKAKLVAEGRMKDIHIGAQEVIGDYVDDSGERLRMPLKDVIWDMEKRAKEAPFPQSYEIETAIGMIKDKFNADGSAKDEYEPDPEDNIPHDVDTQMNMDAPAEEPKIEEDTLNINGMTTEEDVISMIQDTISAGKGDDAKDYLEQLKQYLFVKSGGQAESEELNTTTIATEDKKPIKEAVQITTDSPEEAGMMMQILKLAGVKPMGADMPSTEVPTNDPDADGDHGAEDHDHSQCPVCADDEMGSGEMGRMRDVVTAPDEEKAEETFANEPDEKVQDTDSLVNVHSGGLNKQKQQVRKEYPGDNPLAVKYETVEDKISEQDLANSLRTQYEGFKKSYQEAAKATESKAKPDFLDMDKDGNKKEPMKKAVSDKKSK